MPALPGSVNAPRTHILDLVAGLLSAIFAYRALLFSKGAIFGRHGWSIPHFPREIATSVWWSLHAWTPSNYGDPNAGLSAFTVIAWHALAAAIGVNGGFIERTELVASFTLAFAGMAIFCRTIAAPWAAFAAAVVYVGDPFFRAHCASGDLAVMHAYALFPWLLYAATKQDKNYLLTIPAASPFIIPAFTFAHTPENIVVSAFTGGIIPHASILVPALAAFSLFTEHYDARRLPITLLGGTALLAYAFLLSPFAAALKVDIFFSCASAVALPPLFAVGADVAGKRLSPRAFILIAYLAACIWALPTFATGDLAGALKTDEISPDIALPGQAFQADVSRPLMLPGTGDLHLATHALRQEGPDTDAYYDRAFGFSTPLPAIGVTLLHRSHDDRLGEIVDLARLSDIGYAYVREDVRTRHDLDNPYIDATVLQQAGFRQTTPDMVFSRATLREKLHPTTRAAEHRISADRILADRRHWVVARAPLIPLAPACAAPRFPDDVSTIRGHSTLALFLRSPIVTRFCPPHGELLAVPQKPLGISSAPDIVLYDGDLTAVRAAREAMGNQDPTAFTFMQIGDYWRLPSTRRPAVRGFIGSPGSQTLASWFSCADCMMLEPRGSSDDVDSADWISHFDAIDTESVLHFAVTTRAIPLRWVIPRIKSPHHVFLAMTITAPTTIRVGTITRRVEPQEQERDVRQGMTWMDFGNVHPRNNQIVVTALPEQAGVTMFHAAAFLDTGKTPISHLPTVTFTLHHDAPSTAMPFMLPLDLASGAWGTGVAKPVPPLPALRLDIEGTLPRAAPRTFLRRSSINPAVFLASFPASRTPRERASVLELPEAWNPDWKLFQAPASMHPGLWWMCVLTPNCRPLNWTHLPVNGYANGWIVPPGARGRILIVFEPEISFTTGMYIAIALIIIGTMSSLIILIKITGRKKSTRFRW